MTPRSLATLSLVALPFSLAACNTQGTTDPPPEATETTTLDDTAPVATPVLLSRMDGGLVLLQGSTVRDIDVEGGLQHHDPVSWSADHSRLVMSLSETRTLHYWADLDAPPQSMPCDPYCQAVFVDVDGHERLVVDQEGRLTLLDVDTFEPVGTADADFPPADAARDDYRDLWASTRTHLVMGRPPTDPSSTSGTGVLWLVDPVTGSTAGSLDLADHLASEGSPWVNQVVASADGGLVAVDVTRVGSAECSIVSHVVLVDGRDLTELAAADSPYGREALVHDLWFNGTDLHAVLTEAGTMAEHCQDTGDSGVWRLADGDWQPVAGGDFIGVRPLGAWDEDGDAALVAWDDDYECVVVSLPGLATATVFDECAYGLWSPPTADEIELAPLSGR